MLNCLELLSVYRRLALVRMMVDWRSIHWLYLDLRLALIYMRMLMDWWGMHWLYLYLRLALITVRMMMDWWGIHLLNNYLRLTLIHMRRKRLTLIHIRMNRLTIHMRKKRLTLIVRIKMMSEDMNSLITKLRMINVDYLVNLILRVWLKLDLLWLLLLD